jgi:hypothetical protein
MNNEDIEEYFHELLIFVDATFAKFYDSNKEGQLEINEDVSYPMMGV